jgi:hypothetical protein
MDVTHCFENKTLNPQIPHKHRTSRHGTCTAARFLNSQAVKLRIYVARTRKTPQNVAPLQSTQYMCLRLVNAAARLRGNASLLLFSTMYVRTYHKHLHFPLLVTRTLIFVSLQFKPSLVLPVLTSSAISGRTCFV